MRSLCQWVLLVAGLPILAGCSGSGGGSNEARGYPGAATLRAAQVGHLSAPQARDLLASRTDAVVLDVRTAEEWSAEPGIDGSRLIPLNELAGRMAEIEGDRERPVIVVCRSGNRSRTAAAQLVGAGFREVYNLDGGIIAWKQTEAIGR